MFKSKKRPADPDTPPDEQSLMYIRARHEWDERIGSAVSSAHNWKVAALISMATAACAVLGIAHIGAQSKIQPYGVALQGDKVLPAGPMSELTGSQLKNMKSAELRQFVENVRSVYIDVNAQKASITKAYAYLRAGDPAFQQITKGFKDKSPFTRAESELVKVSFVTVLPLSDDTYQAEWTETSTSPNGQAMGVLHYKATMNTYQIAPTTREAINANPLGFFIKTFNDIQVN
ncbi:type IV secretion system protein [Enterobacter ludwigii]